MADHNLELINAAWLGELNTVKALIQGGADINAQNEGGITPLIAAVFQGHKNVASFLLGLNPNLELKESKNGATALMFAVNNKRDDLVEMLLDKGADYKTLDNMGWNVLFYANKSNNIGLFELFVNKGLDIEAQDELGTTVFIYAAKYGNLEIMDYLFQNGVNIDAVDKVGNSALMLACAEGRMDSVETLIEYGVDVNYKTKFGGNALGSAEFGNHGEIIEILRKSGAI